jgi:exonuclease SbcC
MELSNLTIQQQTLVEKTNHKTELSQNYLEKEQLYNLNIAGALAESLQEGMPCMVCGSVHHPNVAVKHQDAPSEGQLKMLKAELDDVEEKFRVFQTKYLVHKKELENTQNDILESVSKFGISSNDIPEILQTLNSKRNGLRVQYSTLKNEISTAEQNISKLNRVTQNIQENETTFAVLTTSIEDINEQLQGATLERNTLKDTYLNALKSVNIPDEDIHSQLLEEYCNYKSIESVVANFENSLANCSIRINEYNNTIGEHSFVDVSKLEVKLAETNQLLQKKRNRSFEVSERIKTNTAICEKVSKDYKEVIKKYQIYKDTEYLSQVSNGTLSGVEHRIAFSNYVQAYYFEKVMATANQKIHIMSGGRYSLVRTDDTSSKNKKGGLGVKIFDAYTGKHRASSTLSGGETFMVSLSLALGLSEVVQQQSGGIKIDAMFIDEGFGTLDSEQSLQQAIKVLDSLATNDRVVGIISHVNELKEHITNRLLVEKSPSGSTITY